MLGLPGALEEGEAPAAAPDASFTVLHGLYWLCANLAADQLVVLSVDDAHWADTSSLRFLTYLLPRLEELQIALLVATRPEAEGEEAHLLATLTADPPPSVVQPAPLSLAAVGRMVQERLGAAPDPAFTAACHRATGGSRSSSASWSRPSARRAMSPDARTAARVEAVGARTARRWIQLRLGRLPAPAARLARAVAVLERARAAARGRARRARPRRGGRGGGHAGGGGDPRARPSAGLRPSARARRRLRGARAAERSLAHRRAAELMDGEPAAEEHAAEHLLATEPAGDRAIARPPRGRRAHRGAARGARVRGRPPASRAGRAAAAAERPGLLLELGVAEATAGQPAGEVHLQEALAAAGDDPEVALGATLVLAHALGRAERLEDAVAVIDRTAALLRDHDEQTSERLETLAMMAGMLAADTAPPLLPRLQAMRRRADDADAPARGARRGRAARRRHQRARARRRGARPARLRGGADDGAAAHRPAVVCPGVGRAGVGRRLRRGRSRARRRRGREPCHRRLRALRHEHGVAGVDAAAPRRSAGRRRRRSHRARRGRPPRAAAVSHHRHRGARDHAHRAGRPRRGRGGAARASRRASRRGRRPAPSCCSRAGTSAWPSASSTPALADIQAAGDVALRTGAVSPAYLLWRSAAALAQLALGEREAALALAHEELELGRVSGSPRVLGAALRTAGRRRPAAPEGEELLREAVATLEGAGAALDSARALVELGALLRRSNRRAEARALLRRASTSPIARARRGSPTGRRPSCAPPARGRAARLTGLEALTASERRVAELAAQGMTNREIAQALFVTARTVEGHLTQAFQKLDLRSREDLGGALAAR